MRGLLAEPAELDDCFAEALAHHTRTLDAFDKARTRLVLGERLRRSRRRIDARVQLRTALESFEDWALRCGPRSRWPS